MKDVIDLVLLIAVAVAATASTVACWRDQTVMVEEIDITDSGRCYAYVVHVRTGTGGICTKDDCDAAVKCAAEGARRRAKKLGL